MHPPSSHRNEISLESLRAIILENPTLIEALEAPHAARLDRLFESNTLEPLLWDLTRVLGAENCISAARLSSWRMASLLATARARAYEEALQDLEEISAARAIPFRLLPGPQLSFRVYARPELRPLTSLDVLAPAGQASNLHSALKAQRFFELEELVEDSPGPRRHLGALERDGVVVKIFQRSTREERPRPWDRFSSDDKAGAALPLGPEALLVILTEEMATRRFAHSLRLVRDVHEVVARLMPSWQSFLRHAVESGLELQALLGLSLANYLLGTAVPPGVLSELAHATLLTSSRSQRLLQVARALVLQYPALPRHVDIMGRLLQKAVTARQSTPAQSVA